MAQIGRNSQTLPPRRGGDPVDARTAASTSQQAAALAGVGQGHTTDEAG